MLYLILAIVIALYVLDVLRFYYGRFPCVTVTYWLLITGMSLLYRWSSDRALRDIEKKFDS